jgi:hypothetical protein
MMYCKFQFFIVAILVLFGATAMTSSAWAGTNISVGAVQEGTTPSVNSITVTFNVNNGGIIAANGSSTWTETLTQNLTSPMAVSCQASGPANGNYSVTCQATLNLSDGTSYSSDTASDTFLVSQMTVNISGPPYVIIDNSDPYDNSPVDSTYQASVQGAPAPSSIVYEWTVSGNINNLSGYSGSPDSIQVDGAGPEGPGVITCAAFSDGSNQSGTKQVTVQDEYVLVKDPGYKIAYGPYTAASNAVTATSNGQPITFTISGSHSQITGVTSSYDLGIVLYFLNASASSTSNVSNTTALDSATATGPAPSLVTANTTYWLTIAPIYNDYTGILQTWGTTGLLKTGPWQNQVLGSPAYDEKIASTSGLAP